ncbi:alginate lyase family protein [Rhodanobacter sp. FDAARGOS 1247]|uniref:alginate lyase family protein n=1 Tax=Rhodanobacter sp. FDAARGOS 1247 TaxID=2778082 RepID=UPI00194DBD03|nr:alginate lyase family protein [Rhodanobacter sp. FDAARGOS 1247]QRP64507.1 alginate lyase family protein [Rhodanobacter sp. FDAARGOS 1247]
MITFARTLDFSRAQGIKMVCKKDRLALKIITTIAVAFSTTVMAVEHKPNSTKIEPNPRCEAVPHPDISLATTSIYRSDDKTQSKVDERSRLIYADTMRNVWSFVKIIGADAELYYTDPRSNAFRGACAGEALATWARAGALTKLTTRSAQFNIGHYLSSIAFSYKAIRPEVTAADQAVIDSWLRAIALTLQKNINSLRNSNMTRNNIQYWNGLAMALVGELTDDRSLFRSGMEAYSTGVCQVSENGSLPLEISRGQKALAYHLYAVAPLVQLAAIGMRHGIETFPRCHYGIVRLVNFTLKSSLDPTEIEKLTGFKQNLAPVDRFSGERFAWLLIYIKYEKIPFSMDYLPADKSTLKDIFLGPMPRAPSR